MTLSLLGHVLVLLLSPPFTHCGTSLQPLKGLKSYYNSIYASVLWCHSSDELRPFQDARTVWIRNLNQLAIASSWCSKLSRRCLPPFGIVIIYTNMLVLSHWSWGSSRDRKKMNINGLVRLLLPLNSNWSCPRALLMWKHWHKRRVTLGHCIRKSGCDQNTAH